MASTPKGKSRMVKKHKNVNEDDPDVITSTPTSNRVQHQLSRDNYSPVFLPCTQESLDNVDVLWDWNSPQSKSNYCTRAAKRTTKVPSPKLPSKKTSAYNQLKTFEKLKEELRAFNDEIKNITKPQPNSPEFIFEEEELIYDKNSNELKDFFDDSIEEDLILASQLIEEKFIKTKSPLVTKNSSENKPSPRNLLSKSFSSNSLISESPVKKSPRKPPLIFRNNLQELKDESFYENDSFVSALECFKEEDDELLSAALSDVSKTFKNPNESLLKLKTKSLSFGDHYTETRCNVQKKHEEKVREEIERRRQEALAKLKSKKMMQPSSDSETSPVKCSPEEIELKRRQALAKLEAKKQQHIERKRQEALQKLEMSKKKREQQSNISR